MTFMLSNNRSSRPSGTLLLRRLQTSPPPRSCTRSQATTQTTTAGSGSKPWPTARSRRKAWSRAARTATATSKRTTTSGPARCSRERPPHSTDSRSLQVAETAFFRQQCCRLYAEVGLGTLCQTLPPLAPRQLSFYGDKHYLTHGEVVLTRITAETFVKVVWYVSYLQVSHELRIA